MEIEASAEQKAEQLARNAAERAVQLSLAASERAAQLATETANKAQDIAVARAVRDANVDRDLLQHTQRLDTINGSQRRMADSLALMQSSLQEIVVTSEAVAKHVVTTNANRISKRTIVLMTLSAIASYLALFGFLIANVH